MSDVLEYFRSKEPKFREVPDSELTTFIGNQYPEFLQDEEFSKLHKRKEAIFQLNSFKEHERLTPGEYEEDKQNSLQLKLRNYNAANSQPSQQPRPRVPINPLSLESGRTRSLLGGTLAEGKTLYEPFTRPGAIKSLDEFKSKLPKQYDQWEREYDAKNVRKLEYQKALDYYQKVTPEITQIGQDLSRGLDQLQFMSYGLGAWGADSVGAEDTAKKWAEGAKAQMDQMKEYPATVGKMGNIKDAGDLAGYVVEALGENALTMVPMLVSGGVGYKVAESGATKLSKEAAEGMLEKYVSSQVAAEVAKGVTKDKALKIVATRMGQRGAAGGTMIASSSMEIGAITGDIYTETGDIRPGIALAYGLPAGGLDALPGMMILNRALGPGADQVKKGVIRKYGVEGAKSFFSEAGTEGVQTMLENAAVVQADPNAKFLSKEGLDRIMEGVDDAMLKGGIGGAGMGMAVKGVTDAVRSDTEDKPAQEPSESRVIPPEELAEILGTTTAPETTTETTTEPTPPVVPATEVAPSSTLDEDAMAADADAMIDAQAAPVETPQLPKPLAGAKPRYGYRDNNYQLEFESDVDRALYIVSQRKPSKRDEEYMAFLRDVLPGKPDAEIRLLGGQVRNDSIKPLAQTGNDTGVLQIEDSGIFGSTDTDQAAPTSAVLNEVNAEAAKVAGAENIVVREGAGSGIFSEVDTTNDIIIDPVALENDTQGMTQSQRKTYVRKAVEEEVIHNAHIQAEKQVYDTEVANQEGAPSFEEWFNGRAQGIRAEMTDAQVEQIQKDYGEQLTDSQLAAEYVRRLTQQERGKVTEGVWRDVGKLDNPNTRNWFKRAIDFVTGRGDSKKKTRSLLKRMNAVLGKLEKKAPKRSAYQAPQRIAGKKRPTPTYAPPGKIDKPQPKAEPSPAPAAKIEPKADGKPYTFEEADAVVPQAKKEEIANQAAEEFASTPEEIGPAYQKAVQAYASYVSRNNTDEGFNAKTAFSSAEKDQGRKTTRIQQKEVAQTDEEGQVIEPGVAKEDTEQKVSEAEGTEFVQDLDAEGTAKEIFKGRLKRPKGYVKDLVDVLEGNKTEAEVGKKHFPDSKEGTQRSRVNRDKARLSKELKAKAKAKGITGSKQIFKAPKPKTREQLNKELQAEVDKANQEGRSPEEAVQKWADGLSDVEYATWRKRLKLTKTVEETIAGPELAAEMDRRPDAFYDPITNEDTMAEAAAFVDERGLAAAEVEVNEPDRPANALDTAVRLVLIERLQNQGGKEAIESAARVAYAAAEKAKEQGQAIQALSVLRRLSPEGALVFATKTANKAKAAIREEGMTDDATADAVADVDKRLKERQEKIVEKAKKIKEAESKGDLSKDEKDVLAADLLDEIAGIVPPGFWDKVKLFRIMSMLLNPKTALRNIGGNTIMFVLEAGADFTDAVIDSAVGIVTGKRTRKLGSLTDPLTYRWRGLSQLKDEWSNLKEKAEQEQQERPFWSAVKGMNDLSRLVTRRKYSEEDVANLGRYTMSSEGARVFEDALTFILGTVDRGFWLAAYEREVRNQMAVRNLAKPDKQAHEAAVFKADKAIFQDDNLASALLTKFRSTANIIGFGRKRPKDSLLAPKKFGLGDFLVAFAQVPGSILMRGIEWSPLGFINASYEALAPVFSSKRFEQEAFVQAFNRALLGSGGLAGTGFFLAAMGVISGDEDEDPRIRELNRERGFLKYSVNISAFKRLLLSGFTQKQELQPSDLQWSYDWAQPVAMPVAMGADMYFNMDRIERDFKNGKVTTITSIPYQMLTTGAKTLEEQPLLQGISRPMEAMAYTQEGESKAVNALATVIQNAVGSFVPTVVKSAKSAADPIVRERRDPSGDVAAMIQGLKADLPGLSSTLPEKRGIYGGEINRYGTDAVTMRLFHAFLNPVNMREAKGDPVMNEVYRLYKATGETGQVVGRQRFKVRVNGADKVLTPQELTDYQHLVGTMSWIETARIMQDPRYGRMSDGVRQGLIAKAVRDSAQATKIVLFDMSPRSASVRSRIWARKARQLQQELGQ